MGKLGKEYPEPGDERCGNLSIVENRVSSYREASPNRLVN